MKKVIYLMTILFTVVLMSTSCEKEDPIVQTLEEQYPEWSNLFWVSTNENSNELTASPQLNIVIIDNVVHLTETIDVPTLGMSDYTMEYGGITLTTTTIEFNQPNINNGAIVRVYQILSHTVNQEDDEIRLSYYDMDHGDNIYLLKNLNY